MIGAIFGDIAGSTREFNNVKSKHFKLLPEGSHYTDDTLLIAATADTINYVQQYNPRASCDTIAKVWRDAILTLAEQYKYNDWGCNFAAWLKSDNPQPYNSYGNGALLRAIPIGLLTRYKEYIPKFITAIVGTTHNHPFAINAATALATLLQRLQTSAAYEPDNPQFNKAIIADHITKLYPHSNIHKSLTTLADRKAYGYFMEDATSTLLDAVRVVLRSSSFTAAIRNAIYIGGDSDTIAAVTGAIAAYTFTIPDNIQHIVDGYLQDNKELHYIIACAHARERSIHEDYRNISTITDK